MLPMKDTFSNNAGIVQCNRRNFQEGEMMNTSPHKSDFVRVNGINLHYLDWGGNGPVLLFLSGMGCSVHIFDEFALHFTDQFRVLALDRRGHGDSEYPETGYDVDTLTEDLRHFLDSLKIDKAILVGHSLAYIELSRFAVCYPERVLKLVFLDAAYQSSSPDYKAMLEKSPLPKMIPAWPGDEFDTVEDYVATLKRLYPSLAVIWGDVMEEQTKHTVQTGSDGKVRDKMSDVEFKAIRNTIDNYEPEYSKIRAPILSFFALQDGSGFLSSEYMTDEQKELVLDFFNTVRLPYTRQYIQQFRHNVPSLLLYPTGGISLQGNAKIPA
jgi:pimeloyl-ACP methyl ester carboxylesterase